MQFFKCNVCFELFFKRARLKHEHARLLRKNEPSHYYSPQDSNARSFFEINKVNWVLRLLRILMEYWERAHELRTSTFAVFSYLLFGILSSHFFVLLIIAYDFKKILFQKVNFISEECPSEDMLIWECVGVGLDGISQGNFCNLDIWNYCEFVE